MSRVFAWPDGTEHYGDPNPQYDPEACGLEIIDSLSEPNLSYEFNDLVLWRDIETQRYYVGSDSGCSCPSPFENVKGLDDLTEVGSESDLRGFVEDWNRGYGDIRTLVPATTVAEFIQTYRDSRKEQAGA